MRPKECASRFFSRSGDGNRGALRGEIVLLEVGERQSLAEILYLEDAAAMPLPGDNLVKIGVSPIRQPEAEEKKIAASGRRFSEAMENFAPV